MTGCLWEIRKLRNRTCSLDQFGARIHYAGNRLSLGTYATAEEAGKVFQKAKAARKRGKLNDGWRVRHCKIRTKVRYHSNPD